MAKDLEVDIVADSASYFPLESGEYDVAPGLFPLGTSYGNDTDSLMIQVDSSYRQYISSKRTAMNDGSDRHKQAHRYEPKVARAVTKFLIKKLACEHPDLFVKVTKGADIELHCSLNGEVLHFDMDYRLTGVTEPYKMMETNPSYSSALDAIAMQIQEDIAIVSVDGDDNWVSALHVSSPNYWAPEKKIGKGFNAVHADVADFESVSKRETSMLRAMIEKGPFVRFAWGLTTDTRLNHHPIAPPGYDANSWNGRKFNKKDPSLYLRVERQTIHGIPRVGASLFTIRTYFTDCAELKKDVDKRANLISAIQSMTKESLLYKGLHSSEKDIITWLRK